MKKSIIICFAIVLVAASANAQDKPFRVGLKFGIPNIAGLNVEYVTPALNARLAPTADISHFSITASGAKASFTYFELGGNYYLANEGKGPYAHLSYGNMAFKGTWTDPTYGEGTGKVGLNMINIKIGAKWGNGFYFRPEIGYSLLMGGSKVKVDYPGITQEETVPSILSGGFVFNLGFGIAF